MLDGIRKSWQDKRERDALLKKTARLCKPVDTSQFVTDRRILYDFTEYYRWVREGSVVGISRVCVELYAAMRKMAHVVAVEIVNQGGKPELRRIDMRSLTITEEVILPRAGDILFTPGLHIRGVHVPVNYPHVGYLRRYGVKCCLVVHDILPFFFPHFFDEITTRGMTPFFVNALREYDTFFCVSRSVCDSILNCYRTRPLSPADIDLVFTPEAKNEPYLSNGWYGVEPGHAWTSGRSILSFYLCDTSQDLTLTVFCNSFHQVGETRLFFNRHEIGQIPEDTAQHEYHFAIPSEILDSHGVQNLLFLTENAKSPYELGESDDERKLDLAVRRVLLHATNGTTPPLCSVIPKPIDLCWFWNGVTRLKLKSGGRQDPRIEQFSAKAAGNLFLMVGTVEPRKGHAYVLKAFERLWERGETCFLCIIGRVGWKMQKFISELQKHPQMNHRLIFLEGASDDTLDYAYRHAAALIQASVDEGFGLPLIEAGQYGTPVLCSDIPVFREVSDGHALFFDRSTEQGLVDTYDEFQRLRRCGQVPNSSEIPYLTWEQSARQIFDYLFGGKEPYARLTRGGEE